MRSSAVATNCINRIEVGTMVSPWAAHSSAIAAASGAVGTANDWPAGVLIGLPSN